MENDSINITAIISIIGAILTLFIKLFDVISSWRKSRIESIRLKKGIDGAIKEVEFINTWFSAIENSQDESVKQERQKTALEELDILMSKYKKLTLKTIENQIDSRAKKNDKWFYAMTTFLLLGILGMFVDNEGVWSLKTFTNNWDSDTITGLIFLLIIWVYFFLNSNLYQKYHTQN